MMDGFTVLPDAEYNAIVNDLRELGYLVQDIRRERDNLLEERIYLRNQIDLLWKRMSLLVENATLLNPPKIYVFHPDSIETQDVLR